MRKEIELKLTGNTRRKLRENLIKEFLKEKAGKGTGERSSKYFYFVENLNNGKKVFLQRPAILNKGFDFDINVTNTVFEGSRKKTRPTHDHITDDLKLKKSKDLREYNKLKKLIDKIYQCKRVTKAEINSVKFEVGYPADMILLVIKWLFIEQDITYWNSSGRQMFMNTINNI